MNFEYLKHIVGNQNNQNFGKGVTLEEIHKAEQILEVIFPDTYKSFLLEYGWGGVGHIEIYGLGLDAPFHLKLIEVTKSEREEMHPRLQKHLVPLMNDGFGNHFCLDTSKILNGECPIVFWDHEKPENQEPEFISLNFLQWLIDEISNVE
jgi:cell wall assembly regulator SMI1